MNKKGFILSGIQPTGNMHLGNYLGAIRNWVSMQDDYECYFMLADMHAITVPYDRHHLPDMVRRTAATYIASGIDPDKCAIFAQSAIAEHAYLAWIFNCHTPLGWLNRMTQFKEKAGSKKDMASMGLYGYPVLMAADILLYHATHVPVGEDQKQHLELARDIAGAFNRFYEKEFFTLPEPVIIGETTRVMSLRDGTKKMSKSDPSDMSRILLSDDADAIAQKIKKAKSDMIEGMSYDVELRPEASNLLAIYAAVTDQTIKSAVAECQHDSFSQFKQKLADALIAHLAPIHKKFTTLMDNPAYLDGIIRDGQEKAAMIAQDTIKNVKDMVGFSF
jgi:tryptophanyl-tRNA synthetase